MVWIVRPAGLTMPYSTSARPECHAGSRVGGSQQGEPVTRTRVHEKKRPGKSGGERKPGGGKPAASDGKKEQNTLGGCGPRAFLSHRIDGGGGLAHVHDGADLDVGQERRDVQRVGAEENHHHGRLRAERRIGKGRRRPPAPSY